MSQVKLKPQAVSPQKPTGDAVDTSPVLDAHVVILNNYLRPHHVAAYRALAKRVRKLTVLLSVPMEPDRDWHAQWEGLNVILQKNTMFTTKWHHSSGFSEANFIHVPTDTYAQLKSLKPDVILSYEMGMRTMLCSLYRLFHRKCRLVMVGNMSQHIEQERGPFRKLFRKIILRGVDYFTFNGPSCKRYLRSIGVPQSRLFHFPYCIDPTAFSTEPTHVNTSGIRKMLYCGAMSSRKGILQFARILKSWCNKNKDQHTQLCIAGSGPLKEEIGKLSTENFGIEFLGNCDQAELRAAYAEADVCVFPTLADEWGLVPIEAMASGKPVLGSFYAQSVESYVTEGETGWIFKPNDVQSVETAIARCMSTEPAQLAEMGNSARREVSHITPSFSAKEAYKLLSLIDQQIGSK